MKRTNLEYTFRKLTEKLGFNYRFHLYSKTNTPLITWEFKWWKRVPGNSLNLHGWIKEHRVVDENEGWRRRVKKVVENKLPTSKCYDITFSIPGPYSKDNAIYAVLQNKKFTSNTGIPSISSEDELNI